MTKAILINSAERSISEIEFSDWTEIAPLLKCELFTVVGFEFGDLYLDDEGLMHGNPEDMTWFMFDGNIYAGHGLLVGPPDSEGNSTDTVLDVESVEKIVKFGRPHNPTAYVDQMLNSGGIYMIA